MSKHRKTYDAILATPTRASVVWNDAVALLQAAGYAVRGLTSSVFEFRRGEGRLVLHRPHPGNELDRGRVRLVRDFLREERITREDI